MQEIKFYFFFVFLFLLFLLYKTNRFRVAVVLSKNKSEKRQNVKGKSVTHSIAPPELLFCSQLAIRWFANILEGWKNKLR